MYIPMKDESIEEYEFHYYDPITETNFNNHREIRIDFETQDLFTHPNESYLVIEGKLTKEDDTLYTNADYACLTNNALMHLFTNIKYQFSGLEIEPVFYHFSESQGLNKLWYKDSSTMASTANNTRFGVRHEYLMSCQIRKECFAIKYLWSISLVSAMIVTKLFMDWNRH